MAIKRKAKVLRRNNIKRRTGGKAQSKQIMALSKQVSSLTKRSYVSVTTKWIRNNLNYQKGFVAVAFAEQKKGWFSTKPISNWDEHKWEDGKGTPYED